MTPLSRYQYVFHSGLDPLSWTPHCLQRRSLQWRANRIDMRHNSGGRWWSWYVRGVSPASYPRSLDPRPGRLRCGSSRKPVMRVEAMAGSRPRNVRNLAGCAGRTASSTRIAKSSQKPRPGLPTRTQRSRNALRIRQGKPRQLPDTGHVPCAQDLQEWLLRTKGSWVQILPGAPINQRLGEIQAFFISSAATLLLVRANT